MVALPHIVALAVSLALAHAASLVPPVAPLQSPLRQSSAPLQLQALRHRVFQSVPTAHVARRLAIRVKGRPLATAARQMVTAEAQARTAGQVANLDMVLVVSLLPRAAHLLLRHLRPQLPLPLQAPLHP